MFKKVLTETPLFYGEVKMPKGFEIDRSKLKADILSSYNLNNSLSNNPYDYKILDYEVPFSRALDMLNKYIIEHVNVEFNLKLNNQNSFGNIFYENEQSFLRSTIDLMHLSTSPDFTMVYGVDIYDESCILVIEYDDNKIKGQTWHVPLVNNSFYIFPSHLKYFIGKNISKQINTVLTTNFEKK